MFKKATKQQSKLRMSIAGPSGSGKTYSAIRIAQALANGGRVAVIDTERGSASKYVGEAPDGEPFDFDVLELDSFAPGNYIAAIKAAGEGGYDVLVIDSLSHSWNGKDGCLEIHDRISKRKGSGFNAWADVTPIWQGLLDSILRADCHVICTMRSKMEYILETNSRGKQAPRKVGLAPEVRKGAEYEFDVFASMDIDHNLVIDKTRCSALDAAVIERPGKEVADKLRTWLSDGAPIEVEVERPVATTEEWLESEQEFAAPTLEAEHLKLVWEQAQEVGFEDKNEVFGLVKKYAEDRGMTWKDLPVAQLDLVHGYVALAGPVAA